MVQVVWVSLHPRWALSSVQAVLQVVIAIICTVGIFVFSRICWQLSSLHVAKDKHVPLPLLISIRTVGEAFDAMFLLRRKIFLRRHWRLLAQSVLVIMLSAAIIVSGPIAKASTRIGEVVRPLIQTGLVANRGFNSIGYGLVAWNRTLTALDQAKFPYDQLLDYLPDGNSNWLYKPEEWNSTWTMDCNATDRTPLTLVDTGNCTDLYTELPALSKIFPLANFYKAVYPSYYGIYNGTQVADGLMFLTGWTYTTNTSANLVYDMTFSVAAVSVHDLVKNDDRTNGCYFGKGPVGSASFSMAQCAIHRSRELRPDEVNIAFPDHTDWDAVADAYIQNYIPRMSKESAANLPITEITPEQLIRFYQVYTVTKDTFREQPVPRSVSARVAVVQVSATYLAFAILMLVLNLIGLGYIVWFSRKHADIVSETPESKLDWAVQSIIKGGGHSTGRSTNSRYSVVAANAEMHNDLGLRKSHQLRHHFENARFGNPYAMDDSVPLTHNPGPAGGVPTQNLSSSNKPHDTQFYTLHNSDSSLVSPPPQQYSAYPSNQGQGTHTQPYSPPSQQRQQQQQQQQTSAAFHQRQESFPSHTTNLYGATISPYEAQFAAHDTSYNSPSIGFNNPDYQTYQPSGRRGYQQL